TVNEPDHMSGGETLPCLDEGGDDVAPRAVRFMAPLSERATIDELHDDEHAVFDTAHVVNGHHVRMGNLRHRSRFTEQARLHRLDIARLAPRRAHDLECNGPLELDIEGPVHR